MACFHPRWAVVTDDYPRPTKFVNPTEYEKKVGRCDYKGHIYTLFRVPCQQCGGCRMEYARTWADRMTMESLYYASDKCWFITLTYDPEHCPTTLHNLPGDCYAPFGSVDINEISNFMKDLRASADYYKRGTNIRFYGASEYGTESMRPHYHIIVYGLDIPDLRFFHANHSGDALYLSDWIERLWDKGFVVIGHFDWRTASYTARYILKKQKGKNAQDYYDALDVQSEQTRMSLKPGIAYQFYVDHKEEIYYDGKQRIVLPAVGGRLNITTPPRYFDEIFKKEDPERLAYIKEQRRKIAMDIERAKLSIYEYASEEEYLANCEKLFVKKPQFRLDI